MNLEFLLRLLQNPQFSELARTILTLVIKEVAEELNKPEVQKQIVDAIINSIPKQN